MLLLGCEQQSCWSLVQVLALEKLLLVTSTVPAAAAPPALPPLASLSPVNENPPAQPPRGATGVARAPDSPVHGPASPSADLAAADGAALGNGQMAGRGGGAVVGSGIAGAALAIMQASSHSPTVRRFIRHGTQTKRMTAGVMWARHLYNCHLYNCHLLARGHANLMEGGREPRRGLRVGFCGVL